MKSPYEHIWTCHGLKSHCDSRLAWLSKQMSTYTTILYVYFTYNCMAKIIRLQFESFFRQQLTACQCSDVKEDERDNTLKPCNADCEKYVQTCSGSVDPLEQTPLTFIL